MDYRVDYGEEERGAKDARSIADRSPSATSRMRVDLVPAAIPGSMSAGRAKALDGTLVEAIRNTETDFAVYSDALASMAENHRAFEGTAAVAIRDFFGGTT